MKIAIVAHFNSTIGGAYYYYRSLLNGLLTIPYINEITIFCYKNSEFNELEDPKIRIINLAPTVDKLYLKIKLRIKRHLLNLTFKVYSFGFRVDRLWIMRWFIQENQSIKKFVAEGKCDLFIITAPFFDSSLYEIPFIAIIHDLYFLQGYMKNNEPRDIPREIFTSIGARSSKHIISESPLGISQLVEEYDLSAEKISLLPTGPGNFVWEENTIPFNETKTKYNLPATYIFYPGHMLPFKNHRRILEALVVLRESHNICLNAVFTVPSLTIIDNTSLLTFIKSEKLEKHIWILSNVDSSDMSNLYRGALCLCMASCMGPTNMPIWEAMVLGCPVIASDIADHSWQVGEAGKLFNPASTEELVQLLKMLLANESMRIDMTHKGYKRIETIERLKWEKTLSEIIAQTVPLINCEK